MSCIPKPKSWTSHNASCVLLCPCIVMAEIQAVEGQSKTREPSPSSILFCRDEHNALFDVDNGSLFLSPMTMVMLSRQVECVS